MPVVISMLNSYSGWAAAGIGFTLGNPLLIVAGALVGSSGAILSYIMCKGMNRSIFNVILGGFGGDSRGAAAGASGDKAVKAGSADDASFIMSNASRSSSCRAMAWRWPRPNIRCARWPTAEGRGRRGQVRHPPGGGPHAGHMNVLLAEANVPYEDVFELEDINSEFTTADVAFVIGANDVTNPAAKTDPTEPDLRHADPRRRRGKDGAVRQALHGLGLCRRGRSSATPRR